MAYRERQKISQMTPKGADLELTDLLEVSTIEDGSYVTKSITGEEIINAATGGALDLQAVTDNGATTTNGMQIIGATFQVTNGIDEFSEMTQQSYHIENTTNLTSADLKSDGTLQLKSGTENSSLKNTNVTNANVILEFPNKTTGSYTIATTSDLTSGTVTSVGLTTGTTGTDINVTNSPITSSGDITLNIPIAGASSTGKLSSTDWTTFNNKGNGSVTSVGLTMPSAFSVSGSPITTSGTLAVTGAGVVSQYVRGDGSLANFPTTSGGGASVSYYLNGSVSQGTFGGVAMKEINKTPIIGAGTDFTINANGYIQSFITDANDPNQLLIPAGNWNFETYFSASSSGGSPSFYVELYKWDGATLTLIASNSANPEGITGGTAIDLYLTALAIPQTTLAATDRLVVRIYVTHSGRTITLHTENSHLSQIITTFSTGLTALNGLTDQVQNFATGTSGTDFAINSTGATHTFNLPTASSTNTGKLSTTDWSTFNGKQDALVSGTNIKTINSNSLLGSGNISVGTLTSVTGTAPIASSGGTTPAISISQSTTSTDGYLSSTDWTTFNNKASYTPRVQSVTSASTVTPVNTNDLVKITAQAAALALANPTGTWYEGQPLMIRIKDNGTARAITYDTNYRAIGVTLPTTTVVSKTTYLGLIYNATDTKWDVIGVTTQA